jgi:hypothetical protein
MQNEANILSNSSRGFSGRHKEGMLSAVSIGFFLVLVGALFILNSGLPDKIVDFANPASFELQTVAPNLNVSLPIPKSPRAHLLIYQTTEQFCLVWAVFLVAVLGLRFIIGSEARKKADGLGNIVFWFGAAYLIQTFLVDQTKWFEFWATIIALIGLSLIVRGVFLIVAWKTRRDRGT